MVDSSDGWRNTYLYYEECTMPMTVRLNARTERAVNALARRRRQTRSDVVRDALEHYTATNGGDASRGRPYDAWLDVIGVVSARARDRGRTTGEQFTAIVREKARARRAR
jgi:hypothetical protein